MAKVTIHMAASLGFIARKDGSTDWLETAMAFEAKGLGWVYGDKPTGAPD